MSKLPAEIQGEVYRPSAEEAGKVIKVDFSGAENSGPQLVPVEGSSSEVEST